MAYYEYDKGLKGRGRARLIARLRRTVMVALVLLVCFAIAGVIYTWYVGQKPSKNAFQDPIESKSTSILPKPAQRDPNAPVGVAIQTFTTPVLPGGNASIAIRTAPLAECTIKVEYNKIASKDSGLITKEADEYGVASWSWTVDQSTPLGKWPVDILCSLNKKSGAMHGDLEVVNKLPE